MHPSPDRLRRAPAARPPAVIVRSRLAVPPDPFWAAQCMATVNAELGPWIRMSAPAVWQRRPLQDWPPGGPLFASWVLGAGLVPLDRHAFGRLELSQPRRFVESSSSWVNRAWRHEREVTAAPGGCEVIDRLDFLPRLRWLAPVLGLVYRRVFAHRHARLRACYGAVA